MARIIYGRGCIFTSHERFVARCRYKKKAATFTTANAATARTMVFGPGAFLGNPFSTLTFVSLSRILAIAAVPIMPAFGPASQSVSRTGVGRHVQLCS